MKKVTFIVLGVLTGIYILVCVVVYSFQKRIIFLPSRHTQPPPADLGIREVFFPTGDGQRLHGWWMPMDSSAFTVLFFHGNAGSVAYGEERMRFFRELGWQTLMIDYRGFGKSTGDIRQEEDIYEDGESALAFIKDSLGISESRLVVWGWSLGGAVATQVSQHRNLAAVVLEGTFNSMDEIAAGAYPVFPTRWLLKYHFRSCDKVNNIPAPLFFIHSPEDKTIPYAQGQRLYDQASGIKFFLDIGGSHNHGYYEHRDKIIQWLKRYLLTEQQLP